MNVEVPAEVLLIVPPVTRSPKLEAKPPEVMPPMKLEVAAPVAVILPVEVKLAEEIPPVVVMLGVVTPPTKVEVAAEVFAIAPPVTSSPAVEDRPAVASPPANVEVPMSVEVKRVRVVVARLEAPVTAKPRLNVNPAEEIPPEKVEVPAPKTVKVPVAVISATETIFPEKIALPCTPKSCDGVVVPIPTLSVDVVVRTTVPSSVHPTAAAPPHPIHPPVIVKTPFIVVEPLINPPSISTFPLKVDVPSTKRERKIPSAETPPGESTRILSGIDSSVRPVAVPEKLGLEIVGVEIVGLVS